jgi:diaminopimelate epimerase
MLLTPAPEVTFPAPGTARDPAQCILVPATLRLTKYQALGNDYLVADRPPDLDAIQVLLPRICDRHRGIGADGLLAFDPDAYAVRVFNPDGSEAEKSGNGLRITACHAVLDHGAPATFHLRTRDGANAVEVLRRAGPEIVTELDIGVPRLEPDAWVTLDTPAGTVRCRLVDVGNPHCVVLGEPVTEERCHQLGPLIERHPRFPARTNVQLAEAVDRRNARCEIWERGAGYTLASGTSASAVAAALMRLDEIDDAVDVRMPGGTLAVRRLPDGHLLQAGPARRVCRCEVDLADFEYPPER